MWATRSISRRKLRSIPTVTTTRVTGRAPTAPARKPSKTDPP